MRKAQVSIEYLIIIGFVTMISIPMLIIYYDYTTTSNSEIISKQVNNVAQKIVDSAEEVYYLGEPSQTTINAYIPENIEEATIELKKEIVFKVRTKNGLINVIQSSAVNITGSLPITQGKHVITLKAQESDVLVSYN